MNEHAEIRMVKQYNWLQQVHGLIVVYERNGFGSTYSHRSQAMTITVKFFSSLRETLDISSETLNAQNITTVADAWNQATNGAQMPENVLVALNMDYVERNHAVKDGDEVAFFPPVTGG